MVLARPSAYPRRRGFHVRNVESRQSRREGSGLLYETKFSKTIFSAPEMHPSNPMETLLREAVHLLQ